MKILAFAGSLRKDSLNKKLVKIAAQGAQEAGAQVAYIDLKDYPLPLYDQEIEDAEFPENALKLKKLMWEHDGFLIASPEYNSSISGCLKNVIDWTSRQATKEEANLSCYVDKVVTLMAASRGGLGGMRGLVHVRAIFGNIFSIVLPKQKTLPNAGQAFDEQGNLKEGQQQQEVLALGQDLVKFLKKIKG